MPITVDKATIALFKKRKMALIPLHRKHGKRPLHKDWPTRLYKKPQLIKYAENGFNLGFRLGPRDLVVDIDPRNGGSLKELNQALGFDLTKKYPTVRTGSGGYHIYMRFEESHLIDPALPGKRYKFKETVQPFKGIEFKTLGRQVVIPGSIHPDTKERYKWIETSPYQKKAKALPEQLWRLIVRKPQIHKKNEQRLSPKELKEILSQIPVTEYNTNDTWFPMLAASHYATNGTGYSVFIDWCLKDPTFSNDETRIENRWNSLDPDERQGYGTGTLLMELYKHGGSTPDSLTAIDEFEDDFDEDPDHIENKVPSDDDIFNFDTEPKEKKQSLIDYIESLNPASTHKRILKALRSIARLDPVKQHMMTKELSERTEIPKRDLKQMLTLMRSQKGKAIELEDDPQKLEDLAQQICTLLLDTKYKGGKNIIHGRDQNYWTYTGKHWQERPQNMIEQDCYQACVQYRANNPTIDFTTAATLASVERVLRARVATMDDIFRLEQEPKSVINVSNGEIWIKGETGKWKLKRHKPKSYLLSCLSSVKYDPKAECPLFEQTLKEIFALQPDRKDIIRHIWELFGYCLQPRKNIPSWWLFYGHGANGKTLVLRVLSALLGDSVLEHTIGNFDTARNTHAFADLPGKLVLIDEDIRSNTVLPDDFLKKVSENKILLANPKFKVPFRFRCTVTPILAANNVPVTRDLSEGMLRRANVIPFRRKFKRSEMDLDRDRKIIDTELSGVLNKALEGLARLRKRGNFRMPQSCRNARRAWLYESTPILSFLADCCNRGKKKQIELKALWEAYSDWCDDYEIEPRYRYSVRGLAKVLIENGFNRGRMHGSGARTIIGLELKKLDEDAKGNDDDMFNF